MNECCDNCRNFKPADIEIPIKITFKHDDWYPWRVEIDENPLQSYTTELYDLLAVIGREVAAKIKVDFEMAFSDGSDVCRDLKRKDE